MKLHSASVGELARTHVVLASLVKGAAGRQRGGNGERLP